MAKKQSIQEKLKGCTKKELEQLSDFVLENIEWLCGAIKENKGKLFVGACGKEVKVSEAYRCSDCTAPFHRKCLHKHFKTPSIRFTIMEIKKEVTEKMKKELPLDSYDPTPILNTGYNRAITDVVAVLSKYCE